MRRDEASEMLHANRSSREREMQTMQGQRDKGSYNNHPVSSCHSSGLPRPRHQECIVTYCSKISGGSIATLSCWISTLFPNPSFLPPADGLPVGFSCSDSSVPDSPAILGSGQLPGGLVGVSSAIQVTIIMADPQAMVSAIKKIERV